MKRCIPILLALLLLTSCGGKAAPSSQSGPSDGGGLVISQPEGGPGSPGEAPEDPGGDDAIPRADVALVREIVFTYGAKEDAYNQPGTIILKNKSLFLREESWSGENGLPPFYYLFWEDGLPTTEEEWAAIEEGQRYAEGRQGESPFGYGYLGPAEMVEERILAYFEVTLPHLRSDPEYYDETIPGYFMMAGGRLGENPTVSFTFRQDGDILTVPVILTPPDYSIYPETTHTLTVRLEPGGGWKYLGCQVAAGTVQPSAGRPELVRPPAVPHGEELDGVDFSAMDRDGLTALLEPVLERAKFFCRFGCSGELDDKLGIKMDYSPEAAIQRAYRIFDEQSFHPCVNLPYRTVEELKEDICTVFTPDNLERSLGYIFENMTDYDGKIYYPDGVTGYTVERRWELDKMKVVTAEKSRLTLSMPVSYGPSVETVTAPLNFEVVDGYIIMDDSYFARTSD